jgi:hypothetical protein
MSKEAMLTAEVAVLTEMVRVLSDKLAIEQNKQEQGEPVACSMCNEWEKVCDQHLRHITKLKKKRTWVGLADEEFEQLLTDAKFTRSDLLMIGACVEDICNMVEAKLKEKNT